MQHHREQSHPVATEMKKETQISWQSSPYFSLFLISILKQKDYAFL